MVPVLVVLAVFVALELRSVLRRVAPEYKLFGCIELLAVLVREQAVALVELIASEVLTLRAVLVAAVGGVGRPATGRLAEAVVPEFVAALELRSVLRRAALEYKLAGCTELPAVLAWEPDVVLVGLAVLEVQARLVVLVEAALAV